MDMQPLNLYHILKTLSLTTVQFSFFNLSKLKKKINEDSPFQVVLSADANSVPVYHTTVHANQSNICLVEADFQVD